MAKRRPVVFLDPQNPMPAELERMTIAEIKDLVVRTFGFTYGEAPNVKKPKKADWAEWAHLCFADADARRQYQDEQYQKDMADYERIKTKVDADKADVVVAEALAKPKGRGTGTQMAKRPPVVFLDPQNPTLAELERMTIAEIKDLVVLKFGFTDGYGTAYGYSAAPRVKKPKKADWAEWAYGCFADADARRQYQDEQYQKDMADYERIKTKVDADKADVVVAEALAKPKGRAVPAKAEEPVEALESSASLAKMEINERDGASILERLAVAYEREALTDWSSSLRELRQAGADVVRLQKALSCLRPDLDSDVFDAQQKLWERWRNCPSVQRKGAASGSFTTSRSNPKSLRGLEACQARGNLADQASHDRHSW